MSETLSAEAYLPCLLDQLSDEQPEVRWEGHYNFNHSIVHYRRSVLRDLRWLLNSPSHVEKDGLEEFPEVVRSVLNYGTPDLCGKTASTLDPLELERQITESITRFEPRIMPGSLSVKVIPQVSKASPNMIGFEIRGVMWANPLPEQFLLETTLDLETGKCDF